jgi:hypothetical protein
MHYQLLTWYEVHAKQQSSTLRGLSTTGSVISSLSADRRWYSSRIAAFWLSRVWVMSWWDSRQQHKIRAVSNSICTTGYNTVLQRHAYIRVYL